MLSREALPAFETAWICGVEADGRMAADLGVPGTASGGKLRLNGVLALRFRKRCSARMVVLLWLRSLLTSPMKPLGSSRCSAVT